MTIYVILLLKRQNFMKKFQISAVSILIVPNNYSTK